MMDARLERVRDIARQEGITFKQAQQVMTLRRAKMAYEMKWRHTPGAKISSLMGISQTSVSRLIKIWQAHLDEQ